MQLMGGTGLEQTTDSSKEMQNGNGSAAKCAAISTRSGVGDYDDLARLVAAWPKLPKAIRRAIPALVEAVG
jgi:hypothetical protein